MSDVLALVIYAAEVAIAAIILYYVVALLPMPDYMQRVTQALILLVCILSVLAHVVAGTTAPPMRPLSTQPNIMR